MESEDMESEDMEPEDREPEDREPEDMEPEDMEPEDMGQAQLVAACPRLESTVIPRHLPRGLFTERDPPPGHNHLGGRLSPEISI